MPCSSTRRTRSDLVLPARRNGILPCDARDMPGAGGAPEVISVDSARVAHPLFQAEDGGSKPTSTLHASDLIFERCTKFHALHLVWKWHSRLPKAQNGPWQFAFHARYGPTTYAVALWSNPSARCLPHHWLELRRMACAPDSPRCTASRFLAWMVRWFKANYPEREKCLSYQDVKCHKGTIYKACGWTPAHITKARVRDRSKARVGTRRAYRSNLNGDEIDAGSKIRWEIDLSCASREARCSTQSALTGDRRKTTGGLDPCR